MFSGEGFEAFLESAPNGVVLCDRDGHITLVNARLEMDFGYRAEELVGMSIEVLLPDRFRQLHAGHRARFVADPQTRPVAGRELTGRRKDGSEFPVEVGLSYFGEGDDAVLSAVVVDISERKAAEAEVRRSAERLEALHEIDREILGSASIEGLAGSALGRIRDFLGAERAAFVWFDHDEGVGVYVGAVQEPVLGPPAGARIPLEDFPPFALDPQGPPTYLFDLQEWPERSPLLDRLRAAGVRSVVAATLVPDDSVVGALFVSSSRPGAFAEPDRKVLEEVVPQLAVAMQHVRLRDELGRKAATLEARARQQAAVARLGLVALEQSSLDVVLHEAARTLAETLEVPLAKVMELLPSGDAFHLRAGVGWSEGEVGRVTVPAGADSQAGYTVMSGWPVVVEDLATETRFRGPRLLTDHGVVSGLSAIIGTPAAPWGVLAAHSRERREFTPEDVDFLMGITGVLGAAVDRTRAHEEVYVRTRRLEGLREIDGHLLSASSPGVIAEAVLDTISRQVPCDHASVWTREPGERVTFLAVWDREEGRGGPEPGASLPHADVVPVGLDATDTYEPDIRGMDANTPILEWARASGLRSLLVLNLVAGGQHLGGITVTSKEIDAFDPEQCETVREAADHLAIALRKTRLDAELAERVRDLRRLADERRALVGKVIRAQEQERTRVAHELHDGLGQVLTSISLFAGDLEERVPEDLRPRATRLRSLIGRAITDSRTLVWSLHPPELERLGLVPALERLVQSMGETGPAVVELHGDARGMRLAADAESVVYRIVQEALNNAQKHSGATSISVTLDGDAEKLVVVVADDGRGLDPELAFGLGAGLPGMRERALLAGATLAVESAEGAGTTIRLEVPAGMA